jgi:hypothetical protein
VRRLSLVASALLVLTVLPLLGCPHLLYAVPTMMNREPRFPGPAPVASGAKLVSIALDLETEGHFLVYYLRVDGKSLEPSAGPCRRWFMRRGAREAEAEPRSFCDEDVVRFRVAPGVPHRVELLVGAEHTAAKRVFLDRDGNLDWRIQIRTQRVELSIDPEPGSSYTIRGREVRLDLRSALGEDAPKGTRWNPDEHAPVYLGGTEVGSLELQVLRNKDRRVVQQLSVPLYSGRLACEPPFCAAP